MNGSRTPYAGTRASILTIKRDGVLRLPKCSFQALALKSVYRVLARDGRVVWFQCEAKMMRGEDGRPLAFHGVGFDITDAKIAEQDLVRMQDKLLHDRLPTIRSQTFRTVRCFLIGWNVPSREPSAITTTTSPCYLWTSTGLRS